MSRKGGIASRAGAWIALFLVALPSAAQDSDPRAPFITTPPDVVERMLRFAGTGPEDVVVDLGSGDGRIVMEAARKFGARGIGIELDPALVQKSRDLVKQAKLSERVSIVEGDVLQADISRATVVTLYLLPSLIGRLQPRFLDELKAGTRIVSHAFYMPSWKADRTERVRVASPHQGQGDESTLYLWIVPADARGRWEAEEWRLQVFQNFQEIDVEARLGGKTVPIARASLSGPHISWEGGGFSFRGRIDGASMRGELTAAGATKPLAFSRKP